MSDIRHSLLRRDALSAAKEVLYHLDIYFSSQLQSAPLPLVDKGPSELLEEFLFQVPKERGAPPKVGPGRGKRGASEALSVRTGSGERWGPRPAGSRAGLGAGGVGRGSCTRTQPRGPGVEAEAPIAREPWGRWCWSLRPQYGPWGAGDGGALARRGLAGKAPVDWAGLWGTRQGPRAGRYGHLEARGSSHEPCRLTALQLGSKRGFRWLLWDGSGSSQRAVTRNHSCW